MPPSNRIVVILLGLCLIFANLAILLAPQPRPGEQRPYLASFLMMTGGAVSVGIGVFGYRRKKPVEGFGPDWSNPSKDVVISPDAVISEEVGITGQVKRVIVEPDLARVRFEGCHTPRKFFGRPEPEYTCRLAEILAFNVIRTRYGEYMLIVTTRGKAIVSTLASGYPELRNFFQSLGLPKVGGPDIETPQMGTLIGCHVMAGLMLAWWSAPIQEPEFAFVTRMVAGACIGAAASFALVLAGERWLRIRLTYPLLGGFFGAVAAGVLTIIAVSLLPRDVLVDLFGKANRYVVPATVAGSLGWIGGLFIGLGFNRSKLDPRSEIPGPTDEWS